LVRKVQDQAPLERLTHLGKAGLTGVKLGLQRLDDIFPDQGFERSAGVAEEHRANLDANAVQKLLGLGDISRAHAQGPADLFIAESNSLDERTRGLATLSTLMGLGLGEIDKLQLSNDHAAAGYLHESAAKIVAAVNATSHRTLQPKVALLHLSGMANAFALPNGSVMFFQELYAQCRHLGRVLATSPTPQSILENAMAAAPKEQTKNIERHVTASR
jgi:hypothetical protein